jgi:hypothetical protein
MGVIAWYAIRKPERRICKGVLFQYSGPKILLYIPLVKVPDRYSQGNHQVQTSIKYH